MVEKLLPGKSLLRNAVSLNSPYVDKNQKFALFWSAKAGCTFATKWYFNQLGILEDALKYHRFVHRYRNQKFQRSYKYRLGLLDFLARPQKYRSLKIVRNPYERAVSSYLHANQHGYADSDLSVFLGRQLTESERFSFREFVQYLSSIDIHNCNSHFKSQVHYLEKAGTVSIKHVIDLNNAVDALAELESKLDLKKTAYIQELANSHHHTSRVAQNRFVGDDAEFTTQDFPQAETAEFFDAALLALIEDVYSEDFRLYEKRLGAFARPL